MKIGCIRFLPSLVTVVVCFCGVDSFETFENDAAKDGVGIAGALNPMVEAATRLFDEA